MTTTVSGSERSLRVPAGGAYASVAIVALATLALILAARGVLLPERPAPWLIALTSFLSATALALLTRRSRGWVWVCGVLLAALGIASVCAPELRRADSLSYFVYLRSLVFDGDVDFTNEYKELDLWGHTTETGRPANMQSIGPAVVWSPFYLAAHAVVLMEGQQPADGYSKPYRRSVVLGSVTEATLGGILLVTMIARRRGWKLALLAGLGVLASPIPYYMFVVPGMAHAVTFGLACALLWAWSQAEMAPSLKAWLLLGAIFGLLMLSRWQSLTYVFLIAPLAARGIFRRTVHPLWLVAGLGASLLVFTPQLLAWKALYGHYVTVPQGSGFMDWSSPRLLDVLVSADHGLFTWTPAMAGILGLLLALRREPLLAAGGLQVIAATAWVNGGVLTWAASDAFGARRFDLIVPLAVVGLSALLESSAGFLRARPLLVPAALLAVLVLWNLGLIALFRESRYPAAAPLERLAGDQARQLRLALQTSSRAAGSWAPALVYKVLRGEYFYENMPGGPLSLADIDDRDLSGRWSPGRRPKRGDLSFRWAMPPVSCLRLPLERPSDLHLAATLRAPRRCQPQTVEVSANGQRVASAPVGVEWTEIRFVVSSGMLVPGENALCFCFQNASGGADEAESVAAAVATLRLPRVIGGVLSNGTRPPSQ